MATPIKDTPVLTGEDARKFEESLRNPKPVSREDVERARRVFDSVQVVGPGYQRTDVFTLVHEGQASLTWPDNMSPQSLADFNDWLDLCKRKINRTCAKKWAAPVADESTGDTTP